MDTGHWEELRRQARILECDLDSKLSAFGKLGSTTTSKYGGFYLRTDGFQPNYSTESKITKVDEFNILEDDIESLIERLKRVNDLMSAMAPEVNRPLTSSAAAATVSVSQQHTAKRHRDILYDYIQEFKRMHITVLAAKNRDELLGTVHRETENCNSLLTESRPTRGVGDSTSLLMDENQHLSSSDRLLTEHLESASLVRQALKAQRLALKRATGGLRDLRMRFPVLNKLMGKISWRTRRDSIILGTVFGLCLIVLLVYLCT